MFDNFESAVYVILGFGDCLVIVSVQRVFGVVMQYDLAVSPEVIELSLV